MTIVVKPLPPEEARHLLAAQGWLELGNYLEANEELEKIDARLRSHPHVLEERWRIYARAEKWEACLDIGEALVKLAPKDPIGWLFRSAAFHKLKRTIHARVGLLQAAKKFPKSWEVRYGLARYACLLGKPEEARAWLHQAFELGPRGKLRTVVLEDPDLGQIWEGF
jgi:tetratricopeptide (TPR) repeat protein